MSIRVCVGEMMPAGGATMFSMPSQAFSFSLYVNYMCFLAGLVHNFF